MMKRITLFSLICISSLFGTSNTPQPLGCDFNANDLAHSAPGLKTIGHYERDNNPDKEIKITGAVVAPWVKGDLCIGFWYDQEKIKICRTIRAAQDYLFAIPHRIDHIRVYRTFAKACKKLPKGKKECRRIKGRFNTKDQFTELNLTYDHEGIKNYYTIPPKPQLSTYGFPQKDPSIVFRNAQMDNPTAFS
jgi:hypothetical protein